jgi:hypothetical protein
VIFPGGHVPVGPWQSGCGWKVVVALALVVEEAADDV